VDWGKKEEVKIKQIKYIPIGGEKFRIVWDADGLMADSATGQFRPLQQEIALHPILETNPLEVFKTILHESIHGLEKFMVFRLDDEDIERLSQGLGTILVEIGAVDPDKLRFG